MGTAFASGGVIGMSSSVAKEGACVPQIDQAVVRFCRSSFVLPHLALVPYSVKPKHRATSENMTSSKKLPKMSTNGMHLALDPAHLTALAISTGIVSQSEHQDLRRQGTLLCGANWT